MRENKKEKERLVDSLLNSIENMTPEELQELCAKWIKRGGKDALLARFLMGEFDLGKFGSLLDEINRYEK